MKLLELSAYVVGAVIGIYVYFSGKVVMLPDWMGIIRMIQSGNYVIVWPAVFGMFVALGITIGIYLLLNRKKNDNLAKI